MNGQIFVKYEEMQNYIGRMNQLVQEIESSRKEPPERKGGGYVEEQIEQLKEQWMKSSDSMKTLAQASSMFMENAARLFRESDTLIVNPETNKVTTAVEYEREAVQGWSSRTGETAGDIAGASYKKKNPFYNSGYEGQCTWYCYGRFMERTGIALPCLRSAKYWISGNRGCEKSEDFQHFK